MIDPATTNGTPGVATATFKVLKEEAHRVEVLTGGDDAGARVIVRHLMDGWSLWSSPVFPIRNDTVLRQVKYALSREGLFDAE